MKHEKRSQEEKRMEKKSYVSSISLPLSLNSLHLFDTIKKKTLNFGMIYGQ
jgi:hypothetical protein